MKDCFITAFPWTEEELPVNLDTWKLFFKQDEGQHPYVPESAACRLTFTKFSYR